MSLSTFILNFTILSAVLGVAPSIASVSWNGNNWALGCAYNGGDIGSAKVPGAYCSSKCAQTLKCTHFNWSRGTCYLKEGQVSKWDAVPNGDQSSVCGYLNLKQNNGNCVPWNGNNWAMHCDFSGNDLKSVQAPASHCNEKCVSTSGCTHFSWSGGSCKLKGGPVKKIDAFLSEDPSAVCGVAFPEADQDLGCIYWNGNIWAHGCDFKGSSQISTANVPGKMCWVTCAQTPDCTHFVWKPANGGTCFMKKGKVSDSDTFSTGDQSSTCGLIPSGSEKGIFWNGNNWAMACDFKGRDIKSVNVPGDQCAAKCAETNGCTHFAWTKSGDRMGQCRLKSGNISKSDAFPTGEDTTTACGVLSSPDQTSQLVPKIPEAGRGSNAKSGGALVMGVCYDAMHNKEYPLSGGSPDPGLGAAIDADFKQMSEHFKYVRTFYSTFYNYPVAPAAAKYGLKLYLGVYMTDEDWYQNQVDAAVEAVKNFPNAIEAILVGNENLRPNGPYTADQIISRIKSLKETIKAVTKRDVPVGTVQRSTEWLSSSLTSEPSKLAAAADVIGVNIYPFFSKKVTQATDDMAVEANFEVQATVDLYTLGAQWKAMTDRYDTNKVRLTETGFPSAGGVSPSGIPASLDHAVAYYQVLANNWRQGPVFWFSFYDRRSDDHSVPGAFEKHFGIFTADRQRKSSQYPASDKGSLIVHNSSNHQFQTTTFKPLVTCIGACAQGCLFKNSKNNLDVSSKVSNCNSCAQKCLNDVGCTHYNCIDQRCQMKHGSVAIFPAYATKTGDERHYCGIVRSRNTGNFIIWKSDISSRPIRHGTGCTFNDRDISNLNSTSSVGAKLDCSSKCWETKSCTHFTIYRGICTIKFGEVSEKNAVATGDHQQLCGIIIGAQFRAPISFVRTLNSKFKFCATIAQLASLHNLRTTGCTATLRALFSNLNTARAHTPHVKMYARPSP